MPKKVLPPGEAHVHHDVQLADVRADRLGAISARSSHMANLEMVNLENVQKTEGRPLWKRYGHGRLLVKIANVADEHGFGGMRQILQHVILTQNRLQALSAQVARWHSRFCVTEDERKIARVCVWPVRDVLSR